MVTPFAQNTPIKRIAVILAILAALATPIALLVAAQTGTVTVRVVGQVVASEIDPNSLVILDPHNSPSVAFRDLVVWAAANTTDDMVYNMTGTNVNLTISATYSIKLPPSYPSGMKKPYIGLFYIVAPTSAPGTITSAVNYLVYNYTVEVRLDADYMTNYDLEGNTSWVDLPEGFLNELYSSVGVTNGGQLDETQWYPYVYAKGVTVDALIVKHDPNLGEYYVAKPVWLCMIIADPDQSTQSSTPALSGDEVVIVNTDCKFDVDGSNATSARGSFYSDLAPTADYAFITGYTANTPSSAARYYEYNQTDFTLLNFTVTLSDGSTAVVYVRLDRSQVSSTKVLDLVMTPVYPVPYSAVLGVIYGQGYYPYLHVWPMVLAPVGAPAGVYQATIYLQLQST